VGHWRRQQQLHRAHLPIDLKGLQVYRPQVGAARRTATHQIEPSWNGRIEPDLSAVRAPIEQRCWTGVDARLLPPRSPQADPQRIGLELSCGPQSPSYGRGFGVRIYSSYDGATTLFTRGSD
jgi:hypothetical protein